MLVCGLGAVGREVTLLVSVVVAMLLMGASSVFGMAVLCLLTNTPWPWPTPAGAASARGGVPYPRNGAGAEWRGRSAAEVCTSEARKIRVPLARARDGVPERT